MSDTSESQLQQALHQAGFYTQQSPSSGIGIMDEETGDRIDQADIVAIGRFQTPKSGLGNWKVVILIIEDKHVKAPTCTIEDQERQQMVRIRDITGGTAYFAVKWKHKHGDHQFFRINDLQDTGKHWKITEDQDGRGFEDVLP